MGQTIKVLKNDLGYYMVIDGYPVPVEGKMYYGTPEEMAAVNVMAKRILILTGRLAPTVRVCTSCEG